MVSKEEWLDAGCAVLAREGETGLRIDRIAGHLGVTKGSFHHHFRGAAGYRSALVERYEQQQSALLDATRARLATVDAREAIQRLPAVVGDLLDLELERALRAWAVTEPMVASTISQVDRRRLDLLTALWSRLLPAGQARTAALLPHLALIGALTTGTGRDDLDAVFVLLAREAELLYPDT